MGRMSWYRRAVQRAGWRLNYTYKDAIIFFYGSNTENLDTKCVPDRCAPEDPVTTWRRRHHHLYGAGEYRR
jgi:hypothetical protein